MERYAHLMDIAALSGFSIRLALAIILGFFVGLERQWTKHQAGILTNVIVCVGAYAYTAFSFVIHQDSTDLTRVAAQVVSGVGFLGAGLILRDGTNIRGLSTAATIWTTAARHSVHPAQGAVCGDCGSGCGGAAPGAASAEQQD